MQEGILNVLGNLLAKLSIIRGRQVAFKLFWAVEFSKYIPSLP
jgi:hypothetical protein